MENQQTSFKISNFNQTTFATFDFLPDFSFSNFTNSNKNSPYMPKAFRAFRMSVFSQNTIARKT